jgi:hypothetical protein
MNIRAAIKYFFLSFVILCGYCFSNEDAATLVSQYQECVKQLHENLPLPVSDKVLKERKILSDRRNALWKNIQALDDSGKQQLLTDDSYVTYQFCDMEIVEECFSLVQDIKYLFNAEYLSFNKKIVLDTVKFFLDEKVKSLDLLINSDSYDRQELLYKSGLVKSFVLLQKIIFMKLEIFATHGSYLYWQDLDKEYDFFYNHFTYLEYQDIAVDVFDAFVKKVDILWNMKNLYHLSNQIPLLFHACKDINKIANIYLINSFKKFPCALFVKKILLSRKINDFFNIDFYQCELINGKDAIFDVYLSLTRQIDKCKSITCSQESINTIIDNIESSLHHFYQKRDILDTEKSANVIQNSFFVFNELIMKLTVMKNELKRKRVMVLGNSAKKQEVFARHQLLYRNIHIEKIVTESKWFDLYYRKYSEVVEQYLSREMLNTQSINNAIMLLHCLKQWLVGPSQKNDRNASKELGVISIRLTVSEVSWGISQMKKFLQFFRRKDMMTIFLGDMIKNLDIIVYDCCKKDSISHVVADLFRKGESFSAELLRNVLFNNDQGMMKSFASGKHESMGMVKKGLCLLLTKMLPGCVSEIIQPLLPTFSDDVREQAYKIVKQKNTAGKEVIEKEDALLKLLTENPEVIKQLVENNKELFNELTEIVKNKIN